MVIESDYLILPAKSEDVNDKTVAKDGNKEWMVTSHFHEIGSDQQRSNSKCFPTKEDAKRFFEERTTNLCKMMARLPGASIQKGEFDLVITQNGKPIAHMAFMPAARECA